MDRAFYPEKRSATFGKCDAVKHCKTGLDRSDIAKVLGDATFSGFALIAKHMQNHADREATACNVQIQTLSFVVNKDATRGSWHRY